MKNEGSSSEIRLLRDTPLNRALNMILKNPVDRAPAHGCVIGAGDGHQWDHYYDDPPESRKKRKHLNYEAKFKQFERRTLAVVREEFKNQFEEFLPLLVQHIKETPDAPFPVPSFGGSNSRNVEGMPFPDVQIPPPPHLRAAPPLSTACPTSIRLQEKS